MRFRRHIVSEGDTIQSIAQYRLGSIDQWQELARFNGLKHPYIVSTVTEKMKNPEHLVTIGDTLLIRVSEDDEASLISELRNSTAYDQEEIYALALGKDLDILPIPRQFGDPGQDFDNMELKSNDRGQLATVRGIENLKQSLYQRLITPKGSYLGHPTYGSELDFYLGLKNTPENASLINLEIERTLRTDGRVTHVELITNRISGTGYAVSFRVFAMGLEEAFEFVVQSLEQGPIVLLDNFNDVFV